jgi:carboxylesterase
MRKHSFYIIKSILIITSLSLLVLTEYGIPYITKDAGGYINEGKIWNAKAYNPIDNPFVLKKAGNRECVLLVHSCCGTPSNIRDAAEELFKKGFDVYAPLLPGHGTDTNDFDKTGLKTFIAFLNTVYKELSLKYSRVHGVGFSLGGSFLLKQVVEKYASYDSVTLVNSPVMFFGYTRGAYSFKNFSLLFSGITRFFIKRETEFKLSKHQLNDVPLRGYNGYRNMRHYHYIKVGLRKIKKLCFKIKLPILLIYSKGDEVFGFENGIYIYSHVKSTKKVFKKITLPERDISFKHSIWRNNYVKTGVLKEITGFLNNI